MSQQTLTSLSKFHLLNEISDDERHELLNSASFKTLEAGGKLIPANTTTWTLFLLSGELCLADLGAITETLTAGSERCLAPIFDSNIPLDFAFAKSNCKIMCINKESLDTVVSVARKNNYDVVDVDVSPSEIKLFQDIFQACSNGKIDLPAMPEVALRIRKMTHERNVGVSDIAKLVQLDPSIAGRLLNVANSPLYRGRHAFNHVTEAVLRLGFKTTCDLAVGIALRSTFKSSSKLIQEQMTIAWENSVRISTLCYVIANKTTGFSPERALLSGLLHEIGVVPILNFAAHSNTTIGEQELTQVVGKLSTMAGVLVLNSWELDSEFATIVEECHDWTRDSGARPDYCDIVVLARRYNLYKKNADKDLPSIDEIPAFGKLNLGGSDPSENLNILENAEDEIVSLQGMLV